MNKQMVIESLSVENLKIESSITIAEEFGKYFSQIGKLLLIILNDQTSPELNTPIK